MAGFILWQGPSVLDGAPVVVIATDNSENRKTGGMVQTWILRSDVEPHTALKTGEDASVCGDCPHRPANGGACYVTVFQAPLAVYRAFKRGSYRWACPQQFAGKVLRIGSYGDPGSVPLSVWRQATRGVAGYTGYTHQWRTAPAGLARYCMASCDTPDEVDEARALGYRTFRIRLDGEPLLERESVCPASAEAGHKLTCENCRACSGAQVGRQLSGIAIVAHGAAHKVQAYKARRAFILVQ